MKVNAKTTRPIVSAGSITRRIGFLIFLRVDPVAEWDDGQIGDTADQPPDVEHDHDGRPEPRHRLAPDGNTEEKIMMNGIEMQVRGLVDDCERPSVSRRAAASRP